MVHAMYLSMGRRHDYTAALARITADTLVLHGERDLQPVDAGAEYAERIAGAELMRHNEPILTLGISTEDIANYVSAFAGRQ